MGKVTLEDHVKKYQEAIDRAAQKDRFSVWFNGSVDPHHARINGFWDFATQIVTPEIQLLLGDPQNKTALEIGYGGGRLLNAARHYFKHVVGLDIHNHADRVASDIGGDNVSLLTGDGQTIPSDDESVDFIYSFIVFHHLPSFEVFRSYLSESYRCLSVGGVAHLYYGLSDKDLFVSESYSANELSLKMSSKTARQAAANAGFDVVNAHRSWRIIKGEELRHGLQASLVLQKG